MFSLANILFSEENGLAATENIVYSLWNILFSKENTAAAEENIEYSAGKRINSEVNTRGAEAAACIIISCKNSYSHFTN